MFKFLFFPPSSDTCLNIHSRKQPLVKIQVLRHTCLLPQIQQKKGDPAGLLCLDGRMRISPVEEELTEIPAHKDMRFRIWLFLPLPREVCSSKPVDLLVRRCQPHPWASLLEPDSSFLTTNWNVPLGRLKLIISTLTPGGEKNLSSAAVAYIRQWWGKYSTCTPKIPKIMKKAQQMRTIFPIGLKEEIKVSTTSFRPGALLMTLKKAKQ